MNQFTKDSLQSGDVCILRDGNELRAIISPAFQVLANDETNEHAALNNYNSQLMHNLDHDWDVVKVLRPTELWHFANFDADMKVVFEVEGKSPVYSDVYAAAIDRMISQEAITKAGIADVIATAIEVYDRGCH